jgi:hypothetical protein
VSEDSEDTRGGASGGDDYEQRQDEFVERVHPDPSQQPQSTVELTGLLGNSDREGYRRLYFTRSLDYYAEFRTEDVVYSEQVPRDRPPMVGTEATRIALKRDAPIHYTRVATATEGDEFDLDVRIGAGGMQAAGPPLPVDAQTWEAECPGPTWGDCVTDFTCICGDTIQITICRGATCIDVCDTSPRFTCDTCRTDCGQLTCQTCRTKCGQATCQTCLTRCGQATCAGTCVTCQTKCGQATCRTCITRCRQETCIVTCFTCDTCNPHVFTCGGGLQCR